MSLPKPGSICGSCTAWRVGQSDAAAETISSQSWIINQSTCPSLSIGRSWRFPPREKLLNSTAVAAGGQSISQFAMHTATMISHKRKPQLDRPIRLACLTRHHARSSIQRRLPLADLGKQLTDPGMVWCKMGPWDATIEILSGRHNLTKTCSTT